MAGDNLPKIFALQFSLIGESSTLAVWAAITCLSTQIAPSFLLLFFSLLPLIMRLPCPIFLPHCYLLLVAFPFHSLSTKIRSSPLQWYNSHYFVWFSFFCIWLSILLWFWSIIVILWIRGILLDLYLQFFLVSDGNFDLSEEHETKQIIREHFRWPSLYSVWK